MDMSQRREDFSGPGGPASHGRGRCGRNSGLLGCLRQPSDAPAVQALKGRASDLPFRLDRVCGADPRECGALRLRLSSTPAFWVACGDPASHPRRGHCRAGLRPARQSRAGSERLAERVRSDDAGTTSVPGAWIPGLLGRLRRPSVAPSARARGGSCSSCAHADGAPAASIEAEAADGIALPVDCQVSELRSAL